MYPVRWYVLFKLDEDQGSFVRAFTSIVPDEDKINWILLGIYFFILYCVALIIPVKISIRLQKKHKNLINVFLLMFTSINFLQILSGWRMGKEIAGITAFLGFMNGVVPMDLLLLITLMFYNKKIKFIFVFLYLLSSLLIASKAGIIHIILSIYTVYILKGGKIINKKFLIAVLIIALLYPILYYISTRQRKAMDFSMQGFYNFLGKENLFGFALILLSRRISGIDVLMLPRIENNIAFSFFSMFSYLAKGLFTSSIVNFFIKNNRQIGQGRVFAEEFFGQDESIASSFESSLFGNIYLSNDFVAVTLLLSIVIISIFLIFYRFRKKWIMVLMNLYFIKTFCMIIMTGNVTNLTVLIRQTVILVFVFWIYNLIKPRNHCMLKNNSAGAI